MKKCEATRVHGATYTITVHELVNHHKGIWSISTHGIMEQYITAIVQ